MMTKPNLDIDLLLNTVLFICQLLGKFQPLPIVFNGQFEQFVCLICILGFLCLCEITTTKPSLNLNLLSNLSAFIRNLIPSLM